MQRWKFKKADQNNKNQNRFLIITNKFKDAVILPCCFMQLYSKQQSCPGHLYFSFAHGTTQNKTQICLKNLCTIQCGLVWSIRSYKMYLFLVELEEEKKKEWYGYDSKFSVFQVVILSGYDSAPYPKLFYWIEKLSTLYSVISTFDKTCTRNFTR